MDAASTIWSHLKATSNLVLHSYNQTSQQQQQQKKTKKLMTPARTASSGAHASLSPFCCTTAIPSSFRHMVNLLRPSTTHFALSSPVSSAPMLASFLAYIVAPAPPRAADEAVLAKNTYFAVVQVKRKVSEVDDRQVIVEDERAAGEGLGSEMVVEDRGPDTFVSQDLDSGEVVDESSSKDEIEIIGAGKKNEDEDGKGDGSVRYYIPVEMMGEETILDQGCRVLGKTWREVEKVEVEKKLRASSNETRRQTLGIVVGDGVGGRKVEVEKERWKQWVRLQGTERLWCEMHKVWFELRVWVRE